VSRTMLAPLIFGHRTIAGGESERQYSTASDGESFRCMKLRTGDLESFSSSP
jgi:hypothetical protein